EIDFRIETCHIFLPLVSPDYLASRYCYQREMYCALSRHESGDARVIPVILRPCDWRSTPMRKLLALPKDGTPVIAWTRRDEGWLDVNQGVRAAVEELFPGLVALSDDVDSSYANSVKNWDLWLAGIKDIDPEIARHLRAEWVKEHFDGSALSGSGRS